LRDRLAKIQAGASETPEPKKWDVRVKKVPDTSITRYIRNTKKAPAANDDKRPAEPAADMKATQPGIALGANSDGGQVGTLASTPATVRQSAEAAVGGLHLDLVRLAEAYADAAGGVEIAKARLEQITIAATHDPNATAGSRAEIKVQEITVRSAERKFASMRRIAEVVTRAADEEAKSAEEEIEFLRRMHEKGFVSEGEVRKAMRQYQAAQANLKTLRSILAE
jgi:hypothetical protein